MDTNFKVGDRIRTTRINQNDLPPVWHVGNTGTITVVHDTCTVVHDTWANVQFDQFDGSDIVYFDEMEKIDD